MARKAVEVRFLSDAPIGAHLVVSVLSSVEVTKGLGKLGLEGPIEARYRGTRASTRNVAPLRTCPSNLYALVP